MKRLRSRLSFANVVSCLALFIALGGVGYAATELPKDSVGTAQLKDGSVTASKIAKDAVTGADVKDGSLRPADLGASPGEGDESGVASMIYGSGRGRLTRVFGDEILRIPGAITVRTPYHLQRSGDLGTIEIVTSRQTAKFPVTHGWVVSTADDKYRPVTLPYSYESSSQNNVRIRFPGSTGTSFTARDPDDAKKAAWVQCAFEHINLAAAAADDEEMYCFALLSPALARSVE